MVAAGVGFIAPASKPYVGADVLGACELETAEPVDYVAERDATKAPEDRGTYQVPEDTMVLTGKTKTDPALSLRRVSEWSSARAGAAGKARAKKLDRARDDLERLGRGLGDRYYPTDKQVADRIAVIAKQRRVSPPTCYTAVGTGPTSSKPTLAWHIEALINIICLALPIFALVGRAVRLALLPTVELAGPSAGRPAKPTGRLIFAALSHLRLVPATDTGPHPQTHSPPDPAPRASARRPPPTSLPKVPSSWVISTHRPCMC